MQWVLYWVLNRTLLRSQAVKYKQLTGDSLPLLALCVSFLAVLEDLSVHLNLAFSASDASKGAGGAAESSGAWSAGNGLAPTGRPSEQRFADLTRSFPPAACVARFKEYLSPCLPLVGDYGFRAVAPELQRRDEKKLTEYLANTNVDEESLYTNDTVRFWRSVGVCAADRIGGEQYTRVCMWISARASTRVFSTLTAVFCRADVCQQHAV